MEDPSIGYTPHTQSSKGPLQYGPVPNNTIEKVGSNHWVQIMSLLYIALVYVIYYFALEPSLDDKYGEGSVAFFVFAIIYSILVIVFYYTFVLPILVHVFIGASV